MPQKSPAGNSLGPTVEKPKRLDETVEQKAVPVRELYFSQLVRIPGTAGAATCLVAGKPELIKISQNIQYVDSIFMYKGEFIVNGEFFIPKTCGTVFGWRF